MNNINLTGRITMDVNNPPESYKGELYGQTPGGRSFYNNSLAVNMGYKSKESGEWVDRTEFFNIRAYAGTADYLKNNVSAGEKILVEGSLRTEEWTTQDGKKGRRYYIAVHSVEKFIKKDKEEESIITEDEKLPFETADAFI